MGYSTASDLAAGQIAMVGEARYTYEHRAVMTNLCTRHMLGQGEKSYYVPKFGTVTADDLTDGVDMGNAQTMSITGTTHTTDEAGCKVVVTKKLRAQMKEDMFRAAGRVIGNAMGKKIDQDGLALFSGLDSGLGGTTTTFSIDYMNAALTQCYGQAEPVPDPIVQVYHPNTFHEVIDLITTPGTNNIPPELQMDLLRNYWRGNDKLYGAPVFIDGNISRTDNGDSTFYSYSAVFSKMAFIYLVGWEPETWEEYDGSLRGWEIGIVADYAFVEEDGTYGRYLQFYSTVPSA